MCFNLQLTCFTQQGLNGGSTFMQIFFQYIYIEKFSGDLKQHEKLAHELQYRNIFENKEKGMS